MKTVNCSTAPSAPPPASMVLEWFDRTGYHVATVYTRQEALMNMESRVARRMRVLGWRLTDASGRVIVDVLFEQARAETVNRLVKEVRRG